MQEKRKGKRKRDEIRVGVEGEEQANRKEGGTSVRDAAAPL